MIKKFLEENKVLFQDNIILFAAVFGTNIINYFFHFYVGRSLGPADYGVFGVLLSMIYVIAMPLTAIQTVITKFVSEFKGEGAYGKISYLLTKSLKKMIVYGLVISVLFLILSPFIASFLKIEKLSPLFLLSLFLFLGFLIPITRGVLQGLQSFKKLGVSYVSEGFSKLIIGILLVSLGLGVSGAMGGFVSAYFVSFVFTIYFLRKILKAEKVKFDSKVIYKYSFPVIIMLTSLTLFYTLDIILVKHFFDLENAGYYAALSLLGKVIFFATLSVSMVMFPKVSELYTQNKKSRGLLYKSLLLILFMGGCATIIYYLMPGFVIGLLFGAEFLSIKGLVWIFGLVMTIYSLIYVISFYNMSINKTKFIYLLILSNIVELVLIWFYHDTLKQVIMILLGIIVVLFLSLLVYTIKNEKNIADNTSIQ